MTTSLHLKIAMLVAYVALCIALVLAAHDSELLAGHAVAGAVVSRGQAAKFMSASFTSIGEIQAAVQEAQDEQRPDQQEAQVFQEGRFPALDLMADELADPGQHEDG